MNAAAAASRTKARKVRSMIPPDPDAGGYPIKFLGTRQAWGSASSVRRVALGNDGAACRWKTHAHVRGNLGKQWSNRASYRSLSVEPALSWDCLCRTKSPLKLSLNGAPRRLI